jgi:TolB protein
MTRSCVANLELSRFDRIVLSVLLGLAIATGLILVRGDQVGVQIDAFFPESDSKETSTRSEIRITFSEPMDKPSVEQNLRLAPPVLGEVDWQGKTLIWRPKEGLAPDTDHTVTLARGASSVKGRQLKNDLTWTFRTGQPRVAFMSLGEFSQLGVIQISSGNTQDLTQFEDGSSVWDFAISRDGSYIAFGLTRPDASAVDLWLARSDGSSARLLVECDDSQCAGASWSPDGRRLAYERRSLNVDFGAIGMGLGPSRVWLLDVKSGDTAPLFSDNQKLGYAPRWSPDGRQLAYFDPEAGVRIVELDTGASQFFPNQLGEIGTWSPDSQSVILVDLLFAGEDYFSYLIRADLTAGTTQVLTDEQTHISEGAPVWSPTGAWIAFGRKALADGTPTAGQQLWLMRPDASDAHALVIDADAHLGSVAWSPDGNAIVYLRFPLMQAGAQPEVWHVSLLDGKSTKLAERATLPEWIP